MSSSSLDPPEPCILWLGSRLAGVDVHLWEGCAFPFVYASEELEFWNSLAVVTGMTCPSIDVAYLALFELLRTVRLLASSMYVVTVVFATWWTLVRL